MGGLASFWPTRSVPHLGTGSMQMIGRPSSRCGLGGVGLCLTQLRHRDGQGDQVRDQRTDGHHAGHDMDVIISMAFPVKSVC
jgi:hypothetical protein